MKHISPRKWRRFIKGLAFWLLRTEPRVLVPTEWADLHRWKAEIIALCEREQP